MIRATRLFARTRRWGVVLLVVVASGLLVIACGPLRIAMSPDGQSLVLVAMMIPVLPALAIAASLESPLRLQEMSAARSLLGFRVLHVVGLCALACVVLGFAGSFLSKGDGPAPDQGSVSIVRNSIALVSLGLVSYRVIGPRFGWLPPMLLVVVPPLIYPRVQQDQTQIVTMLYQADSSFTPFVATIGLGIGALALVLWSGPQSPLGAGAG